MSSLRCHDQWTQGRNHRIPKLHFYSRVEKMASALLREEVKSTEHTACYTNSNAKPIVFTLLNHLDIVQNIVLQEQKCPKSLAIIRDTFPTHYFAICQL